MPAAAPDEYRIPARISLAAGARYVVRFIDELCMPLVFRGQYKQLPFVVDSAAKASVVPAHLLQQGNLRRRSSSLSGFTLPSFTASGNEYTGAPAARPRPGSSEGGGRAGRSDGLSGSRSVE